MRPSRLVACLSGILSLSGTTFISSQELSTQPGSGARVCVAAVNNRTGKSLFVERMTDRLVRSLSENNKLTAVAMESVTTSDRELRPTLENSEELKRRECNYLVLTQVTDPKSHPTDLAIPQISIGGKAPSVDSSDPSGAVVRDSLEISFALFRPGSPKPVLDTRFLDHPSANVSDSLMQAMDREASRVGHELKKK